MSRYAFIHVLGEVLRFTDDDVVNASAFLPEGAYNPEEIRPWILYEGDTVVAVVFAEDSRQALHEAADAGKLAAYLLPEKEAEVRMATWTVPDPEWLGADCKPYALDFLACRSFPRVAFSFVALVNHHVESMEAAWAQG